VDFGVQDDPAFVRDPFSNGGLGPPALFTRAKALRTAKSLGAATVRVSLFWNRVEHSDGSFDFTRYDDAIDAIVAAGLRPQVTLAGPAPRNAAPDPGRYARLCEAAASRWKGRVRTYSIWNEPNWRGYLPATRTAARYRELFEAGSEAIREADPNARVLFGELAPMGRVEAAVPPLTFLSQVVRSGSGPLIADGFAIHPYTLRWAPSFPGPSRQDVTTGSLKRLVTALERTARAGTLVTPAGGAPPLYLTEYGWLAQSKRIPEPRRSAYAVAGLKLAARVPQVRQVVWYQLVAPARRTGTRGTWDTALLDGRGKPRPAFHAVRRWARASAR
jgi:hypothetical protein